MDLAHVWYDDKVKVTDLEFLYWSLFLSFYNVCICEAFDRLIHVWHGDRNWSNILYGTIPNPKVTDSEFLYKSFVINVLQFQFFLQSLQWTLFMTIEPSLNILRSIVPIPVRDLKIKLTDFFFVKSLQCQLLQSLWLIWIVFGMNGYKILKCFRKEQRI